jgi:hypothetical protein
VAPRFSAFLVQYGRFYGTKLGKNFAQFALVDSAIWRFFVKDAFALNGEKKARNGFLDVCFFAILMCFTGRRLVDCCLSRLNKIPEEIK